MTRNRLLPWRYPYTKGSSNDDEESEKETRKESLTQYIYRKVSNLSLRGNPITTIPISPNCKFKMVTRTWKPEVTVAFMIVGMPDYLLSSGKLDDMFAEKASNDRKLWDRCSFYPCINLWFDGFCAFESTREASRYIIYKGKKLSFMKYDGTTEFKQQASFVFRKKKKGADKRRTKSSISHPNRFELGIPYVGKRKFSLAGFHDKDDGLTFLTRDKGFSKCKNGIDDCLFSMNYNPCLGSLDLQMYNKDISEDGDNKDLLDIEDDSSVDSGVRLLKSNK